MNKPVPLYIQLQEKLAELGKLNPKDNLWEDPKDITHAEAFINPETYERVLKRFNMIWGVKAYNFVLKTYLNAATDRVNELQAQKQGELEKLVRLISTHTHLPEASKGKA